MFVAAITVIFAALFFGCGGTVTALKAKNEAVSIKPDQTIDVNSLVVKEGNGKVSFSVENPDVLQLKGNKLKGIKEGKGAVIATADEFTVRIEVTVGIGTKVKLAFPDTTAVYDGGTFFINPTGTVPEGTTVKYACGGKEFNGATEAGTYEVTATVTLPDGYVLECDDLTATLTIQKARYDMSAVSFPSRTLRYNGKNQVVSLSGTLPEGVSVTYKNNSAKEVGSYVATAIFEGSNPNYEEIGSLSCKYTIEKGHVLLPDCGLKAVDKVYDGEKVVASVAGLPSGAKAEYYEKNGDGYAKITAPEFVDAGTYEYYVRVVADESTEKNYLFLTEREEAIFTESDGKYVSQYFCVPVRIKKADLETGSLVLRDGQGNSVSEIVYGTRITDGGTVYGLNIENGAPNGVKNEFFGRYETKLEIKIGGKTVSLEECGGLLTVGKYAITATYEMPEGFDKNYNEPAKPYLAITVKQAKYDVSGLKFTQSEEEKVYDGTATAFGLAVVPEELNVTYSIKRNGNLSEEVLHAGSYEIRAELTFKDAKIGDNYEKIPAVTKYFTVKPDTIILDGVEFNGVTKTYDGVGITPEITIKSGKTLPESVSVEYVDKSGNKVAEPITNAGKYAIIAVFYYEKGKNEKGDFKFVIGENEVTELTAVFVINKAKYNAEQFDERKVKTEEGKTYRHGMLLKEIAFVDYMAEYIKWSYPGEEIGELVLRYGADKTTVTGREFVAEAVFNADETNYEDYTFKTAISLNPMQIDLTGTTVPDQFVVNTGAISDKIKIIFGSTEYEKEIKKIVTFLSDGTATVELVAEKKNNYVLIGDSKFENVSIYIYNADEFTYKVGTTIMTEYKRKSPVAEIPSGTTEIASRMFENSSVTTLVIPDSVVSIPKNAFWGMYRLEQISFCSLDVLPEGRLTDAFGSGKPVELKVIVRQDEEISSRLYYGADYVREVEYLKPVVSIGKEAFSGCSSLTNFKADLSKIKSIGEWAFKSCVALESLVLPSLLGSEGQAVALSYYFDASIGKAALKVVSLISENDFVLSDNAFGGATGLERISLGKGLTSIGQTAFKGVFASVDLRETKITEISDYSFANYNGKEVLLPSAITKIGTFAFAETVNLFAEDGQRFVVPATVTFIGRRAFYRSGINELKFERNSAYTEVIEEAFYGFSGKKITLPNTVKKLGKKAFSSTKAKSIFIGNGVTEIGENCFDSSGGITSFIVPENVDYIAANAFLNCSALTKITFGSLTPPTRSALTVFATGGAVITFVIKVGADETAYKNYFEKCGASGRYVISKLA